MTIKKLWWVFLIPLVIGGCFRVSPVPKIYIEDDTKNFDFATNQQFQLVLPSNHTTGYEWAVIEIDEDILEFVGSSYILSDKYNEDVVGAGGEEVLTFRVQNTNSTRLSLEYLKPWEVTEVANTFMVTINGAPEEELDVYYGTIIPTDEGAEYDDYFRTLISEEVYDEFGIEPLILDGEVVKDIEDKIAEYTEAGALVEIKGKMIDDVPDYGGRQFMVHEIKFVGA